MKVDVLAPGMLTCVKPAFDFLAGPKEIGVDLATIPAKNPRTQAMISKADTLGTFQIERRAQMSMLPRILAIVPTAQFRRLRLWRIEPVFD
jgi:error-prone DNA polymerase